jgi:SPP1 gp7 family putative phage head morphogenesis protein
MAKGAQAAAFRRLQALADLLQPRVQRQIEEALRTLERSIPITTIEKALRSANPFAVHDLLATLPTRLAPAARSLERLFLHGVEVGTNALPPNIRVHLRFDSRNLPAQMSAKQSAAKLITHVTAETRAAVRELVTRAFRDGVPPRDLAKQIKPLVGLTRQQAKAVERHRADLQRAGFSNQAAQAKAARYADKLRRLRAMTIARTEVIRASTEGQLASWRQAVGQGLLSARSEKVWITTQDDRLCPYCRPMDGQQVLLDVSFRTALGRVNGPPLHPNCRCALAVAPVIGIARRAA